MLTATQINVYESFDALPLDKDQWKSLLQQSQTNTIFLTQDWLEAWWQSYGRGKLLLVLAEKETGPVVFAPLFAEAGMIFFVGSGGSDYLDFIGDTSEPEIFSSILDTARKCVPNFLGFRFYHVPDQSRTGERLQTVAQRLGFVSYDEGDLPSPYIDFKIKDIGVQAANRSSLVRHEKYFVRNGKLEVHHWTRAEEIVPRLEAFFAQHISRWENAASPSLFLNPKSRDFYRNIAERADRSNYVRFTEIDWEQKPIAFHFGFSYNDIFLWYKPSFDIALSKRSPGEVLLRQLLLSSMAENEHIFDFGLGDEAFKLRFASQMHWVRNWGVYPK